MNNSIKESMQSFAINQALNYLEGNPEENLPKLMALADKLLPDGWYESQRSAVRDVIAEKNNCFLHFVTPKAQIVFAGGICYNGTHKRTDKFDRMIHYKRRK